MEEGADWISGQGPPPDPRPAGPPPTLGRGLFRLEVLQSLSLAHTKVSGNAPAELAGLPALQTLDVNANAFAGAISEGLFGRSAPYATSCSPATPSPSDG